MPAGKPYGLYRKSDNKLLWRFDSKATGIAAFAKYKRTTENAKYQIKELPEYAKCPIDKTPAVYADVCDIVSNMKDWTIVNPKVDMMLCTGTCDTKKPHDKEHFAVDGKLIRSICKECRNKNNKALRDKHAESIKEAGQKVFECRGNKLRGPHQVILTTDKTSYYGKLCPDCKKLEVQSRYENNKTNGPSVAERREQLKDLTSTCSECGKVKTLGTDFILKTGRLGASSICKECYNKRGYHKTYRAKRRAEDLYGYLERNAAVMRDWRERNAEHCKEYMKKYNSGVERKWEWYKNRAAKEQLPLDEAHKDEIKEFFLSLCTYCAREPDLYDVNGLDRIDNTKGYTIDNIVACCKSCNMMKRTASVADFLAVASRIAEFHDNPDMDLPYPISNMNNGEIVPTKYKTLDASKVYLSEYNKNDDTRCYLCNIPRSETPDKRMTVDRIDSDIDYLEDNVAPCCSACNMAKRDYNIEEFIAHCHRISNRVDDIMEELDQVATKTAAGPAVIQDLPVTRMYNQYVPHARAKPVLIRDPNKDSGEDVVAAYPSRAAANNDLHVVAIRENISKGYKLGGAYIVKECSREVYEATIIPDEVYEDFKAKWKNLKL